MGTVAIRSTGHERRLVEPRENGYCIEAAEPLDLPEKKADVIAWLNQHAAHPNNG